MRCYRGEYGPNFTFSQTQKYRTKNLGCDPANSPVFSTISTGSLFIGAAALRFNDIRANAHTHVVHLPATMWQ
jgi:hypothetical protein